MSNTIDKEKNGYFFRSAVDRRCFLNFEHTAFSAWTSWIRWIVRETMNARAWPMLIGPVKQLIAWLQSVHVFHLVYDVEEQKRQNHLTFCANNKSMHFPHQRYSTHTWAHILRTIVSFAQLNCAQLAIQSSVQHSIFIGTRKNRRSIQKAFFFPSRTVTVTNATELFNLLLTVAHKENSSDYVNILLLDAKYEKMAPLDFEYCTMVWRVCFHHAHLFRTQLT